MATAAPAAPTSSASPTAPASKQDAGKAPVDPKANGQAPQGTEQKPPEGMTAAEKKAWKLAINGKEQEIDISGIEFKDPKLEEKLKTLVQKGLGADEKFQHSAKVEKMLQQVVHLIKTDPMGALSHPIFGLDVRKVAEEFLAKQLERETLPPERRAILEEQEKLKAAEEKLRGERDEYEKQQAENLRQHYTQEYSKDIISTLDKSGLPKSPRTVQRMAYYMHEGLKRGVELKASDVVELVRADYVEDMKSLMGGLDEDTLLSFVGDDIAGKIRKAELKRLKTPVPAVPQKDQPAPMDKPKSPQYRSTNDFEKLVNERL